VENIRVYDPTTSWREKPFAYAPRPSRLEGLRLGLVENGKYNSAALLKRLAEAMTASCAIGTFKLWTKQSPSQPARAALLAEVAAECDIAVCGVGD